MLAARLEHRRGQDWLGPELGVPARTVSRILRRHQVPRLAVCDPMTGEVIRAVEDHRGSLRTRPARRAGPHGRQEDRPDPRRRRLASPRPRDGHAPRTQKKARIGFDYVHSVVDDHSRFAYSEILADEQGRHVRRVLRTSARAFAAHGITIDAVMTDNHWSYTHAHALAALLAAAGINHVLIKPHCPWQNGKVERFNRTLQTEWAYRSVFATNTNAPTRLHPGSRTTTLAAATAPSEASPDQPTVTNLMAEYS